MRVLLAVLAVIGALALWTDANLAQDKKETTLKGLVACAKCKLAIADECMTVIVVKDDKTKKDVIFYFDKASHDKFHDDICSAPKAGMVVGTVKDDGKKKVVAVKKVTYE
jgi:hypothetical protein